MPPPYKSIGRCIYCGKIPKDISELTKEHIIPHKLNGMFTIPNASCSCCQKIINKFETTCLRGFLLPARLHLKLRISKDSPKTIRLLLERNGVKQYERVGPENFPLIYLPIFTGPLRLLSAPPCYHQILVTIMGIEFENAKEKWRSLNAENIWTDKKADICAFSRMLSKIAHCFAVMEVGLDHFKPLLIDEILGYPTLYPNYYVGCSFVSTERMRSTRNFLHELSWYPVRIFGEIFVIVRVQLFSVLSAPAYDVVVGTMLNPDQGIGTSPLWG